MSNTDDTSAASSHYARLSGTYDALWDHTPAFRRWMVDSIAAQTALRDGHRVADIGGGTGIFAAELLRAMPGLGEVLVVDPSEGMLAQVPRSRVLRTLCSPAERAEDSLIDQVGGGFDLILIKEAVHHFSSPARTLQSLSRLLAPGGTLLIVMLPKVIEYPLFSAALRRFTERQPDPQDVSRYLRDAGLVVDVQLRGYPIELSSERWIEMVGARFMSLLSTFDDDEITMGVREVRNELAGSESVCFTDTFAFVRGCRPG